MTAALTLPADLAGPRSCDTCIYECQGLCRARRNLETDPNGRPKLRTADCETHRRDGWIGSLVNGTCGRRGRWWELRSE